MFDFIKLTQLFDRHHPDTEGVYLLVDAAQQPEMIQAWLEAHADIPVRSLFENTLESDIPLYAAPMLIQLNKDLMQRLNPDVQAWSEQGTMLGVINARLLMDELIAHLQPYLEAKLPSHEVALFRIYDPQVTKLLPKMLSNDSYCQLFEPLIAWFVQNDEGQFELLPKTNKKDAR